MSYYGYEDFWDWWHNLPPDCFCKVYSMDAVAAYAEKERREAELRASIERLEQQARRQREYEEQQSKIPRDVTLDEFARQAGVVIQPFNEPWMMLSQLLVMALWALKDGDVIDAYTISAEIPLKCILVTREYEDRRDQWFRDGTLGSGYSTRGSYITSDSRTTQLEFDKGLLFLKDERAFSPWSWHYDHKSSMRCNIIKPAFVKLSSKEQGYDGDKLRNSGLSRMSLC